MSHTPSTPPSTPTLDLPTVERACRVLLTSLGYDVSTPALLDTPARCARAWQELLSGRYLHPEDILGREFEGGGYDSPVVLRRIPFASTCEHHLLPFSGLASVSYLPRDKVVGLSKLARLVELHARRLQLQERMTADIAHDLERVLEAKAVGVIVRATHSCMCYRGVRKPGAEMVTSTMLGVFRTDPSSRAEVLHLMGEI